MPKRERLPSPRNTEGNAPRPSTGATPYQFPVSEPAPTEPKFVGQSPVINIGTPIAGNSVYYAIHNPFDPRTTTNSITALFPYVRYVSVILNRMLFERNPGRAAPATSVIDDMIANIADISRMLAIYCSALGMLSSGDSQLYARAETMGLLTTLGAMQVGLSRLPLPGNLVRMITKYVGMIDVSSGINYQNVGFLATGNWAAFVTLRQNVENRNEALRWLYTIYPQIGQIGDKGVGYNADVLEVFINAHASEISGGFAPYTTVAGSTDEPSRLISGHVLKSLVVSGSSPTQFNTLTGWSLPSGSPGNSVRCAVPFLCTYDLANTRDAAISRVAATAVGTTNVPNIINNADLAENLMYEYDMGYTQTTSARLWTNIGGTPTTEDLASNNPRYRGNAGRSIDAVSITLDQNVEAALSSMLDN